MFKFKGRADLVKVLKIAIFKKKLSWIILKSLNNILQKNIKLQYVNVKVL